jgi:hypothetical protein
VEKIYENICKGLQIVATRLFNTLVVVDRDIWRSSSRGTVLFIWDMEVSLGIPVLLCEAEVNNIDLVIMIAYAHQKIGGFDVAMDEVTRVDMLDT